MKVKEGKRLICPGSCSRPWCSRESSRNRERERRTRGPKSPVEQGCLLNSVRVNILYYKVASSDQDQKRPDFTSYQGNKEQQRLEGQKQSVSRGS